MAELTAGDVILLGGRRYELLSEPFLGQTGSSVFDSRDLFWRALARSSQGAGRRIGYVTWPVDLDVPTTLDTTKIDS